MSIENLRAQIDRIDAQMVGLLNRRVRAAQAIGKLKNATGGPVYAPQREAQIHRRLASLNKGPLPADSLRAIYTEIISACRASERKLHVAFLGPEGTFSHQAARSQFGASFDGVPAASISQVFSEVEAGRADYGVVPIENSSEGGVGATKDAFVDSDLKVCCEFFLRVHHALMAQPGVRRFTSIYSKAEVFGQCRAFLAARYPDVELRNTSSTAEAARLAARQKTAAAIASREAAPLHGLKILHSAIEDNPVNVTRFLVLSRSLVPPSGNDKTSLLCFIRDEVGALFHILTPLKNAKINMTKIESWPSRRKPWDYCFFIDFLGHCEDPAVAKTLSILSRYCKEVKLLGSYPAGAPLEPRSHPGGK